MRQKMMKQRQLSLERQRNAAKSTFAPSVKAQELPMSNGISSTPCLFGNSLKSVGASPVLEEVTEGSGDGKKVTAESNASPRRDADPAGESAKEQPRPQTANSVFTSLELVSNDGDRCGGRATAEQQGIARPGAEAPSWDLSVNVSNVQSARGGTKVQDLSEAGAAAEKKWWRPSMPFRGNRAASGSPMPRDADAVVTEQIAAFDRSGVRTPDSTDRTFHGPNRRAPARGYAAAGRPPVPERRSNNFQEAMPGGIADPEALARPRSGGSNHSEEGRNARARQSSPFGRRPSPSRVAPVDPPSPNVAFGGVSAFGSGPGRSAPPAAETEVSAFRLDSPPAAAAASPAPAAVTTVTPIESVGAANLRDASPSPTAGAGEGERKRGGRRGWRPWRANKDPEEAQ
eukprot:TRINITY_DN46087_c0_g1_i1.p1 TRINITY_DN46087_c0_g1~~TRINITY_DN46087_c0_g1_i1.p1  ORF type:complete len:460 (+),score=85.23 TRINITY_DN46087_c0_g1_i1:180-1382(+)